jgi:hypothetical protein
VGNQSPTGPGHCQRGFAWAPRAALQCWVTSPVVVSFSPKALQPQDPSPFYTFTGHTGPGSEGLTVKTPPPIGLSLTKWAPQPIVPDTQVTEEGRSLEPRSLRGQPVQHSKTQSQKRKHPFLPHLQPLPRISCSSVPCPILSGPKLPVVSMPHQVGLPPLGVLKQWWRPPVACP